MTKRKHSGESDADASYILLCPPPAKKVKTIVGAPSKPATVYKFKISSNIQQVLNADKQNKKIWEDVRMQEYGTKKDLNDFIEEKFECIVCQDVVFLPITTFCSHNYCKDCLKRSLKAGCFCCSACRNDLEKDLLNLVNKNLRKALQLVFPSYKTSCSLSCVASALRSFQDFRFRSAAFHNLIFLVAHSATQYISSFVRPSHFFNIQTHKLN